MSALRPGRKTILTAALLALPAAAVGQETAKPEERYFDSAGVRIHYTDEGDGAPVVLVHGFATDLRTWDGVNPSAVGFRAALLGAGFRAVALDLRGHGLSECPHGVEHYGVEMAEDVRRLLDHLEIERAHVVGYSLGAVIVNKLRELHPQRLISVTLGGAGWPGPPDTRQDSWERSRVEAIASLERDEGIGPLIRYFNPDTPEEQVRAINATLLAERDQRALAAVLRGGDRLVVSRQGLEENEVPALAVMGSEDPFLPDFRRLAATMARLEPVILEGGDHISTFGSPEFTRRVLAFLSKPDDADQREKPGQPGR